jgi:hypothetical protein
VFLHSCRHCKPAITTAALRAVSSVIVQCDHLNDQFSREKQLTQDREASLAALQATTHKQSEEIAFLRQQRAFSGRQAAGAPSRGDDRRIRVSERWLSNASCSLIFCLFGQSEQSSYLLSNRSCVSLHYRLFEVRTSFHDDLNGRFLVSERQIVSGMSCCNRTESRFVCRKRGHASVKRPIFTKIFLEGSEHSRFVTQAGQSRELSKIAKHMVLGSSV